MSKKNLEVDDRMDIILREALGSAVRVAYKFHSTDKEVALLDKLVSILAVDPKWVAFKDEYKVLVQEEAVEILAKLKDNHARMSEEAALERDRYKKAADEKQKLLKEWEDASPLLREMRSMLGLLYETFSDAKSKKDFEIITECQRAIFLKYLEHMGKNL